MSGVDVRAYWLATYAWDICNFLVPAAASALIILAFNNPDFVGDNYGATVVAFLLYGDAPPRSLWRHLPLTARFSGTSIIPFTYSLSFAFQQPGTAQNMVCRTPRCASRCPTCRCR